MGNQPTSDPPRDSYADVIEFDGPDVYFPMTDDVATLAQNATIGSLQLIAATGTPAGTTDGPINGNDPSPYAAITLGTGVSMDSENTDIGRAPQMDGLNVMAAEAWVNLSALPSTNDLLFASPSGGSWGLKVTTGGSLQFFARNASTTFTASATATTGAWIHVVGVVTGSATLLYVNGLQAGSASFSGTMGDGSAGHFSVGSILTTNTTVNPASVAIYRHSLTAARVAAHYAAGVSRGFARGQLAGERMGRLLDSVRSQAPRNLLAGSRPLAGQWTGNGQGTLDALREVENAEAVDAVMFIASDGTITFLDGGHRSTSPWNTVQAVFGDAGGTELDYMDIQVDYSDSFIANEWNVTRAGGTVQTASDATSQSQYLRRPQNITGLKLRDDSDAADVAADMLAKYKDPFVRVLSITPKTMDVNVADAVFSLEIGDKVTVKLTPLGGGARFSQDLWIQSIQIDADPASIYPHVRLGVSPV
jgi:hypothetical protein